MKKNILNNIISANELKTKGVSALRSLTADGSEAIITVRGKAKYVVLPTESYNHLRECELESALAEVQNDIKKGKYIEESVEKHIKRIING